MLSRFSLVVIFVAAETFIAVVTEVSSAEAQSPDRPAFVLARPLNNRLNESYKADVPVSGNVIAGVMFSAGTGKFDEKNLISAVRMPITKEQLLCVRVTSRDGQYTSMTTFVVEPTQGETKRPVQLLFPTKYKSDLSELADQITIAVSENGCDGSSRSTTYFAATTGGWPATSEKRKLIININSFGATDVFLRHGQPEKAPRSDGPAKVLRDIPCKYLSGERRTTFDYQCEFDPGSNQAGGSADLTIIRQRYGRELAAITLKVNY
jgi:hypothetical protein